MLERAKVNAASAAERLQRQFPHWKISAESAADSPSWGIVQKAEKWGADLIVVGSHGYSSLGRWVLGSVSQTVLTQAPCSVRIARGRHTPIGRPLRILVGVDGSNESEMAVRAVAERIWPAGTDIRLVMVVNPAILDVINTSTLAGEDDRPKGHVDHRVGTMLERFAEIAHENPSGATVATTLLSGDPKKVLPKEAEFWGADCLFIGSRGLSNWERLLLGSVSTAVAIRTQCSVEVVRQAP
jgi:nucleotide-binding universal stress UspA family protein